jgi:predicted nucleic acid-binding protein
MICLDANVLIEVMLGRSSAAACQKFIDSAKDDLAITILSLDLVMYYAERNKLEFKKIESFLRLFAWLPIVEEDARRAFELYANDDYEDALQIACANREKCKVFATLDKALAKKYDKVMNISLIG